MSCANASAPLPVQTCTGLPSAAQSPTCSSRVICRDGTTHLDIFATIQHEISYIPIYEASFESDGNFHMARLWLSAWRGTDASVTR